MRSILLFMLSLGIGLVTTWAGLHYDSGLLYVGYLLVAGTLILWLWTLRGSPPALAGFPLPDTASPPTTLNERDRLLWALRAARAKAVIALTWRGRNGRGAAYREIQAALLSAEKAFQIPPLTIRGADHIPYKFALAYQIQYIDSFYALLAQGHAEEAKRRASSQCVITI